MALHYLKSKITGCDPQPVDPSVITNFLERIFGADWPIAHFNYLVFPSTLLVGVSIAVRHWVLQEQTSIIWSFLAFLAKFCSWFFCIRLSKLLLIDAYKLNPDSAG